jgi:hypothetical protein
MARKEAKRARDVVDEAKASIAAYVEMNEPDPLAQSALAGHSIRLAKLDELVRAQQLNPSFAEAEAEDVEDLLALLAIVPFDKLIHSRIMLLNPTFNDASKLVGGADTDLISGDMLVDFKTTKSNEIRADDLDQLLGYLLLARRQRLTQPELPAIGRFANYYCRHGYLWALDATIWTQQPEFLEIEEWLFKRASEVFRAPRIVLKRRAKE